MLNLNLNKDNTKLLSRYFDISKALRLISVYFYSGTQIVWQNLLCKIVWRGKNWFRTNEMKYIYIIFNSFIRDFYVIPVTILLVAKEHFLNVYILIVAYCYKLTYLKLFLFDIQHLTCGQICITLYKNCKLPYVL